MIEYYSYTVALLLIYPQSTNQKWFTNNLKQIGKLLQREKTETESNVTLVDIACDKLNNDKKQSLCNEAMELMITFTLNHDIENAGPWSFLETESSLPVPQLVDPSDPYTCKETYIEGFDMEKRMYWCKHRVYTTGNLTEIQAEGFFVSSSRKVADRVFLFRPAANDETVIPFAKIDIADLLLGSVFESSSSSEENQL